MKEEQSTIRDATEEEAREAFERMISDHQALTRVIVLIQGELVRLEMRMHNHANWMGTKGWELNVKAIAPRVLVGPER